MLGASTIPHIATMNSECQAKYRPSAAGGSWAMYPRL